MKTLREIAFYIMVDNVDMTKEDKMAYAKSIKELIPTVNGNEELANIVKKWLNTTAKVLGDESYKLVKNDPINYAQLLEVAATFVENPNPRYIKVSWADYYRIAKDSKFEVLVYGTWFKMARLKDGEIVIYEMEDTVANEWTQKMLFGEVVR